MVHGSIAAEVPVPPPTSGERARRGAPVPPRAQDRGRHRRRPVPGRGAPPGPARDGRARPEERGSARHLAHPLADGFLRRCALRDPEPAADARPDRVHRGHHRARDRDDGDAVQHARCADLPAVPRAAPTGCGHIGEHFPRQQLRRVLLSRVPGHPRPHEELCRRHCQHDAAVGRLRHRARGHAARPGRDARLRELLPRARSGAAPGPRFPRRRRHGPRPRCRGRARARLLEAGIRGRPVCRRPVDPLERHGIHRRRRRAGIIPGDDDLCPSRLLRAAVDGAGLLDESAERLLRGPG